MSLSPPPTIVNLNKDPSANSIWTRWFSKIYDYFGGDLWDDELAALASSLSPGVSPTLANFGATGITRQYEFNRGDSVQVAFHIRHSIKRGSLVYPHIHWSTDGTSSGNVEWVISYEIAKGHQQEEFAAQTPITLVQTANANAWHHHIVEASDAQAFVAPEVDSLILMRITRGSTSDTYTNAGGGHVFGLYADLHYQKDRFGTPQKSPNFYER